MLWSINYPAYNKFLSEVKNSKLSSCGLLRAKILYPITLFLGPAWRSIITPSLRSEHPESTSPFIRDASHITIYVSCVFHWNGIQPHGFITIMVVSTKFRTYSFDQPRIWQYIHNRRPSNTSSLRVGSLKLSSLFPRLLKQTLKNCLPQHVYERQPYIAISR